MAGSPSTTCQPACASWSSGPRPAPRSSSASPWSRRASRSDHPPETSSGRTVMPHNDGPTSQVGDGRGDGYGRGDVDPPRPPADVLQRYNARVLDPVTAVRRNNEPLRPTVYVADELIVPVTGWQPALDLLGTAAREL